MSKIESENERSSDSSYSRRQRRAASCWVAIESLNLIYFENINIAIRKTGMGLWRDL